MANSPVSYNRALLAADREHRRTRGRVYYVYPIVVVRNIDEAATVAVTGRSGWRRDWRSP
jgi:hypothetical protein